MQTRREIALKLAALAAGIPVFGTRVVLADPGPRTDAQANTPRTILSPMAIGSSDPSRAAWPKLSRPRPTLGKPNGYVRAGGWRCLHRACAMRRCDVTRNAGDLEGLWEGPSLGFDAGADGDRTMMRVYNLPRRMRSFAVRRR